MSASGFEEYGLDATAYFETIDRIIATNAKLDENLKKLATDLVAAGQAVNVTVTEDIAGFGRLTATVSETENGFEILNRRLAVNTDKIRENAIAVNADVVATRIASSQLQSYVEILNATGVKTEQQNRLEKVALDLLIQKNAASQILSRPEVANVPSEVGIELRERAELRAKQQIAAEKALADAVIAADKAKEAADKAYAKSVADTNKIVDDALEEGGRNLRVRAEEWNKFIERADAMRVRAAADVAAVTRQGQAENTGRDLLALSFTGRAVNTQEISKVSDIIRQITSEIEKGNITAQRAMQVFIAAQRGQVDALTGVEGKIAGLSQRAAGLAQTLGVAHGRQANAIEEQNRLLGRSFEEVEETGVRAGNAITISFAGMVRLFVVQTLHTAIRSLFEELKAGVTAAAEFEIKISEIRTISQDSTNTFNDWSKAVRSLSDEFGNPVLDVAEGTYETISNQIAKGDKATQFMAKALQFARTTVSSTADSVNLLSSALNAYGLGAESTDKVASILFKTIDLGRVRASDLANSFGRVASLAAPLGVKLEEVAASIATLTIQGIKYNEAYTLINNILIKLIHPTTEMKSLLDTWGFSTGEAAIATLGFNGVLEKLQVEAKKGSGEINQLFNEMRGTRGILGLSGDAFSTFQADLQKIKQSGDQYVNAQKIAAESAGRDYQIEINRIKNIFIHDFGEEFLHTIVSIGREVDDSGRRIHGFSDYLRDLIGVVKLASLAAIVYKGQMIAVAGAEQLAAWWAEAASRAQGARALGFASATTAGTAYETVITRIARQDLRFNNIGNIASSLSSLVVPLTAGVTLFAALGEAASRSHEEAVRISDNARQEAERIAEEETKSYIAQLDKRTEALKDSLEAGNRLELQHESQVRTIASRILQFQITTNQEAAKALKDAFDVATHALNTNITKIHEAISEVNGLIKRAQEQIYEIQQGLQQGAFDAKVKNLAPDAQVHALQDEITRLRTLAVSRLTDKNPDAAILAKNHKEATEALKEVQRLENEIQTVRGKTTVDTEKDEARLVLLRAKVAHDTAHRDFADQIAGGQEEVRDAAANIREQQAQLRQLPGGSQRSNATSRARRLVSGDIAEARDQLAEKRDDIAGIRAEQSAEDRKAQEAKDAAELAALEKKLSIHKAVEQQLGTESKILANNVAFENQLTDALKTYLKTAQQSVDANTALEEKERKRTEALKTIFEEIAKFKNEVETVDEKGTKTYRPIETEEDKKTVQEKYKALTDRAIASGLRDQSVLVQIANQRIALEQQANSAIDKHASDLREHQKVAETEQLKKRVDDFHKAQGDAAKDVNINTDFLLEKTRAIEELNKGTAHGKLDDLLHPGVQTSGQFVELRKAIEEFKKNPLGRAESSGVFKNKVTGQLEQIPGETNAEIVRDLFAKVIGSTTSNSAGVLDGLRTASVYFGQGKFGPQKAEDVVAKDLGLGKFESLADWQKEFQDAVTATEAAAKAMAAGETQEKDLRARLAPNLAAVQAQTAAIQNSTETFIGSVDKISKALYDLSQETYQANVRLTQFAASHGIPITKSRGGIVAGFGSGGSVGSDTIPAMLTDGEYVVRKDVAQRNRGVLDALNHGVEPVYRISGNNYNFGSSGSTNHINLNVAVHGSGKLDYDAREIGLAISREIEKGTVTFGDRRG